MVGIKQIFCLLPGNKILSNAERWDLSIVNRKEREQASQSYEEVSELISSVPEVCLFLFAEIVKLLHSCQIINTGNSLRSFFFKKQIMVDEEIIKLHRLLLKEM